MSKLLTAKDLTEMLQVPLSWVWRQAREGRLPTVNNMGRKKRFDPKIVHQLYFASPSSSLTIQRKRMP